MSEADNKTSDKNVANIEEDIKYVKEMLEIARVFFKAVKAETNYKDVDDVAFCNAVEHILADYTRQKQINEEHQKINGELREKVKELENENISKQKAYDDCYCEYKHYKQFESISIQKIIEKIEELKKLIEKIKEDNQYSNEIPLYEHDIKLLEELLQESEDK